MRFWILLGCFALGVFLAPPAGATIFGGVRGIVHDPLHRPIAGAQAVLRARSSDWSQQTRTNADGEFDFTAVPLGEYSVSVTAEGFRPGEMTVDVASGGAPILHFLLEIETVRQSVTVSAAPEAIPFESSASQSVVNRAQIARTPGASQTNSLAMITDFVPGAYIVHDQLHIRGGHQVSWLVDGVPVPNTSIASNVGPQFDPKDIDYIEVQRGGYSAEYGDRTFGVFNVVARSGFERNQEAELVANYGNFHTTNDQLSLGSHTERFAYYASVNANRSDLGLETPVSEVVHDLTSGVGGFASLIFNATPRDQLRLVTSLRRDHYQIPNTPADQSAGIRDLDRERDAFVNFSWVRTASHGLLFTVSPYYHFNRADYLGLAGDRPVIPENDQSSHYVGANITLAVTTGSHNAKVGVTGFAERENTFLSLTSTDPSLASLAQRERVWGNVGALFVEDQYRLTPWLTLNGGVRLTRFSGAITETAADPRLGAALRLPKLGWTLHGYYGRFYQAPPLTTVSGPLLDVALAQGFGFIPLRGERDEQHEFGLTIPARGWLAEITNFRTGAKNFFDHDALGNSNIFFPLTLERARIRGWEASLRSPRLFGRASTRLAYSRQYVEAQGGVSGGLTDFAPPENAGYYFLDHDQRDTLSANLYVDLPRKIWASLVVAYGSGFLNGDGPAHLPSHTTADLALGKSFGESWSLQVQALNLMNRRYLLDNSNTFGGTHFAQPRQVAVELRYRFHF
ncbi:MAG: TonB-dependent receptor [Acidobacteriia bacterium]|nr:TonB-dependent receptor [Terriglobia bacterium]